MFEEEEASKNSDEVRVVVVNIFVVCFENHFVDLVVGMEYFEVTDGFVEVDDIIDDGVWGVAGVCFFEF